MILGYGLQGPKIKYCLHHWILWYVDELGASGIYVTLYERSAFSGGGGQVSFTLKAAGRVGGGCRSLTLRVLQRGFRV